MKERQKIALDVVQRAGEILKSAYNKEQAQEFSVKSLQDYVTKVDSDLEEFIRNELLKEFPEDGFFGEETGGRLSHSGWVLDPIDGTGNFIRHIPFFCISLAYVSNQVPVLAFIYDPIAGEMFTAEKGKGAFLNGSRIKVSNVGAVSESLIGFGHSFRVPVSSWVKSLSKSLNENAVLRSHGSAALGITYVACGRLDAFYEKHLNAWDMMAARLLVLEAGGSFSEFDFSEFMQKGGECLASNSRITEQVSDIFCNQ